MDRLRLLRFLAAIEVEWDRATGLEAPNFCCWAQASDRPISRFGRRADRDADLPNALRPPAHPHPLSRYDPARRQRDRLIEILDHLVTRIAEARREGVAR